MERKLQFIMSSPPQEGLWLEFWLNALFSTTTKEHISLHRHDTSNGRQASTLSLLMQTYHLFFIWTALTLPISGTPAGCFIVPFTPSPFFPSSPLFCLWFRDLSEPCRFYLDWLWHTTVPCPVFYGTTFHFLLPVVYSIFARTANGPT